MIKAAGGAAVQRARLVGLLTAVLTAGLLSGGPLPAGNAASSRPAPAADPAPPRVPGIAPPLEKRFLVADGVVRRTLAYGPAGLQQTVDVFTPARGRPVPRPTVLLVHGGGWLIGDSTEWADEAVELVQARGWTAVSVNYRLAPAARWPAQLEDATAALALLRSRAGELGVDVDRMGAIGDSAGGHLAALLGEPGVGRAPLRSVITWSGVNDLAGVTTQPSSGGCAEPGCTPRSLAAKVVEQLMACAPRACPSAYRQGSPAAAVGRGHAATLGFGSEAEQVDPRQAWVMDAALHRSGVPSRVHVLAGKRHARGYQDVAWPASLHFLSATLTPETSLAYPRPPVRLTLDLPERSEVLAGRPVRLRGVVRPRQAGSTVRLQVQQPDGSWRTAREAPVRAGAADTYYDLSWTPAGSGTTAWRAVWRGGGAEVVTPTRLVVAR